jgi:ABC-type transport system involved in cytochrome bd biosynthesis fused ATPase/permease subunit
MTRPETSPSDQLESRLRDPEEPGGPPPIPASDAPESPPPRALEVRVDRKCFADPDSGVQRQVLAGVRFALFRGEFAALIGPSGCGKSTLLHLIAGLDAAYDGRIRCEGELA